MKQFFTDAQVRKFTLKEKFEEIFSQLNLLLSPVTEKKSVIIHFQYSKKKTISHLVCLTYNEKRVNLINDIKLPFGGIEIKVENGLIEIIGENFCYRFPPDMMPEIWRRLKRML